MTASFREGKREMEDFTVIECYDVGVLVVVGSLCY